MLELIPLLLIGMKLGGVIHWSWWWVLTPIWIALFPVVLIGVRIQRQRPRLAVRIGLVPVALIGVGLLAMHAAYLASRRLSRRRFARLLRRSEGWGPPTAP